jgi:hypothetical protein
VFFFFFLVWRLTYCIKSNHQHESHSYYYLHFLGFHSFLGCFNYRSWIGSKWPVKAQSRTTQSSESTKLGLLNFILECDSFIVTLTLQLPVIIQDWKIAFNISVIYSIIPFSISWIGHKVNWSAKFFAHYVKSSRNQNIFWLYSHHFPFNYLILFLPILEKIFPLPWIYSVVRARH